MSRVLITGGAGFIGGHLARFLQGQGVAVAILDDFSSGTRANVAPGARLTEGCITDPVAVAEAIKGCDAVVHLAALVSVPACIDDWQRGHEINLLGTLRVFEAAAADRLPVIYASSAAIYGDQGAALCRETTLPAPKSPYGADKLACEHQARAFWETKGLPSVGLRFFNIYGPGQSINSPYAGVVARFCDNAKTGTPHTIFGDGKQVRDFVFVSDLVKVISRILGHLRTNPRADVLNVCTNTATSLNDLVAMLDAVTPGSAADLRYADSRIGDIRYSRGDESRLTALLGPLKWTSMADGLSAIQTLAAVKASYVSPRPRARRKSAPLPVGRAEATNTPIPRSG